MEHHAQARGHEQWPARNWPVVVQPSLLDAPGGWMDEAMGSAAAGDRAQRARGPICRNVDRAAKLFYNWCVSSTHLV